MSESALLEMLLFLLQQRQSSPRAPQLQAEYTHMHIYT